MNMHSGQAAEPVVAVGDHVKLGQLIAREEGRNSSPVHASVSGTVKSIEEYESEPGKKTKAILIESDGKMEIDPSVQPPEVHDLDGFLMAVRQSGIVGLGGAAFPLWAKLDAIRKGPIKTVLINGAECEPYITSDHRTMLDNSDMIVKGVELLKEYLHSEEFILGIEDNKKDAIEKMGQVFAGDPSVTVKPLKSVYPQGAKQVLLYNAAGLVVGEGQRLASLGYIIINVTTLAKMAEYITTGMPLVERCITVDGSAVKEPKNLLVPVGTRISYLIDCCGGLKAQPGKVIFGGPMMGKTAYSMEQPVLKATNAIVVMNKKDSAALEPTACIHCGRCVENCPLSLNPTAYAHALDIEDRAERYALLDREKVSLCMECGCCSYVCPARRPLVENNRECKSFVRRYKAELAEKEESKIG
jgi:electron transport complex protein RnfC